MSWSIPGSFWYCPEGHKGIDFWGAKITCDVDGIVWCDQPKRAASEKMDSLELMGVCRWDKHIRFLLWMRCLEKKKVPLKRMRPLLSVAKNIGQMMWLTTRTSHGTSLCPASVRPVFEPGTTQKADGPTALAIKPLQMWVFSRQKWEENSVFTGKPCDSAGISCKNAIFPEIECKDLKGKDLRKRQGFKVQGYNYHDSWYLSNRKDFFSQVSMQPDKILLVIDMSAWENVATNSWISFFLTHIALWT